MKTYEDIRKEIAHFITDSHLSLYDLVRIAKDMCACRKCKFFVQHYDKEGKSVDFGHCRKNNIPKPKRPHDNACGFWEMEETEDENA